MEEFNIDKTISYWQNSAKYDLSVAAAMFKSKKYPYSLFMGHLALEKLLKALIVKNTKKHAPYSHSLPFLAEKSGADIPEEKLIKLREIMEFHIEARYPDASMAFYKKCTKKYTSQRFKEIKDIFKWVKTRL